MAETPRIAIVVDNPHRDLEGMTLLATHLVSKGAIAYLVPMYHQGFEVPSIAPHVVLVNFIRDANIPLIRSYHEAGIRVGVLDTEGGTWESPKQFAQAVAYQDAKKWIDFYYFWGEAQCQALREYNKEENLGVVTGCPRHDFYVKHYRKALENPFKEQEKEPILFVSNLVGSFPRFVTAEQEMQNQIACGYDKKYLEEVQRDERQARKNVMKMVRELSLDFPERNVIVRPHPFEQYMDYVEEFKSLKNVFVEGAGSISHAISHSLVILQMNSSAAVDSYLMDKPVINLDWCLSDLMQDKCKLPSQVSARPKSYMEAKMMIKNVIQGKKIHEVNVDVEQEIKNWFGSPGNSADTIANLLIEESSKCSNINNNYCREIAAKGSREPNLRTSIDKIGRKIFSPRNYIFLRNRILTKKIFSQDKAAKVFTPKTVSNIVKRISNVDKIEDFHISYIESKDVVTRNLAGSTVKLSR
ncbi:MAG: surface carbohydrate biosynthesis protein [Oligoflexales bacterium]